MSTQKALAILQENLQTLQEITKFNYGNDKDVSSIVLNEISNLESLALTKPEILECEQISIEQATKYVLQNNLTFDPNAGLVYVKTRGITIKDKDNVERKSKIIEIQPTCEGLISIAYQCGKILDHERPSIKKNDAGKVVEVTFRYLKHSFGTVRWVDTTFDETDFRRWMIKSHEENGRWKADKDKVNYANKNYFNFNGGIDPEFARAKAIRHAMKKMGTNIRERLNVFAKPSITNTININAEIEAINDDSPTPQAQAETKFTPFEEMAVPNVENPTVRVTVVEEMKIPNSDDL